MDDWKSKKIAVVMGGFSREREVSLRGGAAVLQALQSKGYNAVKVDPKEDGLQALANGKFDAAFLVLHGRYDEDGCMQGFLEINKIPYTGSGVFTSALSFDKLHTKAFLAPLGVTMAKHVLIKKADDIAASVSVLKLSTPVIVKPNREGSTIGMTIVRDKNELAAAIANGLNFCDEVLVEEFITGTEVTSSILNGKALPLVEIAPKSGFYDYQSKYTAGMTEYHVPARIDAGVAKKIADISEKIAAALGCRGTPRADYIVDKNGTPYFLEINTIPGMTATSLLPKAAKATGIEFADLCEMILKTARLD